MHCKSLNHQTQLQMALLMSVRSLAPGLAAGLAPGLTNTFRMRKAKLLGPSSRAPRPGRTRFSTLTASASPVKIAVIYYSTYGEHTMPLLEH